MLPARLAGVFFVLLSLLDSFFSVPVGGYMNGLMVDALKSIQDNQVEPLKNVFT